MKLLTLLAAVLLTITAFATGYTRHEQAAYDLLDAMKFEENFVKTTDIIIQGQITLTPEGEEALKNFTAHYMNPELFKSEMARVYQEVFTTDELKELTAFYQTELGQKTLQKMPEIIQKSAAIQNDLVNHLDELEALIFRYSN